ncbi:hypothetical protein FB451DRAFT_1412518 [Mycena latifolia]|nr:hypothetical protein FB451DRAFT_1412518 [Mycena latifolia]
MKFVTHLSLGVAIAILSSVSGTPLASNIRGKSSLTPTSNIVNLRDKERTNFEKNELHRRQVFFAPYVDDDEQVISEFEDGDDADEPTPREVEKRGVFFADYVDDPDDDDGDETTPREVEKRGVFFAGYVDDDDDDGDASTPRAVEKRMFSSTT